MAESAKIGQRTRTNTARLRGRCWPAIGESPPHFESTKGGPHLARTWPGIGRIQPDLGQIRTKWARDRPTFPTSAGVDPNAVDPGHRVYPTCVSKASPQIWKTLGKLRPSFDKFGQIRSKFGHKSMQKDWPMPAAQSSAKLDVWPKSVKFCPEFGNMGPKCEGIARGGRHTSGPDSTFHVTELHVCDLGESWLGGCQIRWRRSPKSLPKPASQGSDLEEHRCHRHRFTLKKSAPSRQMGVSKFCPSPNGPNSGRLRSKLDGRRPS